jgi:hypothetical protein
MASPAGGGRCRPMRPCRYAGGGHGEAETELTRSQWLAAAEPAALCSWCKARARQTASRVTHVRAGAARAGRSAAGLNSATSHCAEVPRPRALRHTAILRGNEPALVPTALELRQSPGEVHPEVPRAKASSKATHVCAPACPPLRATPLTLGTQVPEGVRALILPPGWRFPRALPNGAARWRARRRPQHLRLVCE